MVLFGVKMFNTDITPHNLEELNDDLQKKI